MRPELVKWQWGLYPENHRTRANLVLHLFTVPLFLSGTLGLLSAPVAPWVGLGGLGAMAVALVAQGRGHKGETAPPVPFLGPGDFVSRFFVEQWVNFPRFVLSGGFAKAWREAGR
jgi:hypothetical protein